MKRSYLDYAMSVIVARALPDARDGLNPVHRRILYSAYEQVHTPDKRYVNPALSIDELINIIPGPDFPTGGVILGRQGIRGAYHLGRGSIVMRGKVRIDALRKDREVIIITEIPYQVNKATMVERMGELHR